ncbi:phage tail fiber domain-containing protein [Klebsiella grimontii]|uniref:phage tail fiber domain-containing protein n=1 Tax=Klebsiella grimontii TaxID=2058152 RepID=UPI001D01BF83|nr:phage tail fiber protein [Klebsiella grimontii]
MSVPNQTPYNIYTANGLTTVFTYEFYIISASDLQISINGSVVTGGYTVAGVGNKDGGDITFLTPPANGAVVMLERVVPTYRLTDYQDNGDLLADTVNKDFDRLWMAIQRAFIDLGFALTRPFFGGPFNAKGYRIENLADPVNDQDAATKKYVLAAGNTNLVRTLRVPESFVDVLPSVAARRNSLLGWNSSGRPVPIFSWTDTADLALKLASDEDDLGDSLVAHRTRTVRERFDDEVSVLDFGPANQFGTAMMAAMDFVMSQGGGTIFVPGRSYTLDTTIVKTLTADIHIRMSSGADVVVKSAMDVYNLNTGDYLFCVESGKTTVTFNATAVGFAVFRITGRTLKQTCCIEQHTLRRTLSFNIGYFVYAVGANSPEFLHNHISAASVVYHLESSTENSGLGLVANAMEAEVTGNKIYNCSNAIEIVNKGYYGCEGIRIKNNILVCGNNAITVLADSSLRAAYMPPVLHIIGNHINAYRALFAQKVSRIIFSQTDLQSKFRADDSVLGMIELYSCQGFDISGQNTFTAVSQDGSGKSNINTPIYIGDFDSKLPSAYGKIDGNTFWLDGMTAKEIGMSSTAAYTGQRIKYGLNTLQSLAAIIPRDYGSKLKISEVNTLSTYDVSEGLAYSSTDANYAFDSTLGILYIKGSAPARDLHIISTNVVPNGVTINQIVAENTFGRQLVIQFAAAEITLTHGANLIAPDQKTTKMWLPTFIVAEFLNNQQCRIVSISGIAARHVISNPGPGATGSVGDQYFDPASGNWKVYMPNGTFRIIATSPNT